MKSLFHPIASMRRTSSARRRIRSRVSILLFPGLLLGGCYGQFPLTRTLYRYNGRIHDSGFVQSVVMWILGFFWIYSGAILIDLVVFNLVEFWTGENPMVVKSFEDSEGNRVTMTPSEDGSEVRLDRIREGEIVETRNVVKHEGGRFEVKNEDGAVLGNITRKESGDLELSKAGETEKVLLTQAQIDRYLAEAAAVSQGN